MGFLSSIFGQKQNDKPNPDLEFYERFIDRIVISEALKSDLNIKLKQAFEDPKSFYDHNGDFILSERGLTYAKDALLTPKFVLIDTLQDNGEMAEVDWKEEESVVRTFLNEIRLAKSYDFTISDDDLYEGIDTGEIITLIDEKELKSQGYAIVLLDINSDSYVFTVVPLSDKNEVKMMFEKLK
jgi:hypothetical protein